jgi:hypothetical protein
MFKHDIWSEVLGYWGVIVIAVALVWQCVAVLGTSEGLVERLQGCLPVAAAGLGVLVLVQQLDRWR